MKFIQLASIALSVATAYAQDFCTSAQHSGTSVEETSNKVGSIGDVGYELWSDSGNNSATFYSDGSFKCSFSNAKDYLCRSGLSFDSTKTPDQIGELIADFKLVKESIQNVDYSYVGVYGWTRDPLVEYYVVDNWLSQWRPGDWVGEKNHGDFTIDGAEYTVYENTRFGPSIDGDTQFKQYFSIRKEPRECGSINISAHFKKWEELGMKMGKLHEAKVLGEAGSTGSGTSGTADFPYAKVYIGGAQAPAAQAPATPSEPAPSAPANQEGQTTKSLPANIPADGQGAPTAAKSLPPTQSVKALPTDVSVPATKTLPQNQGQQNQDPNQWQQQQQPQNQDPNQWQQQQQQNQDPNQWQQQQQQQQNQDPNQWQQQQQQQQPMAQSNSEGGNCAGIWGQCGGVGYNGPTCCSEGSCKQLSEYFHQCQN